MKRETERESVCVRVSGGKSLVTRDLEPRTMGFCMRCYSGPAPLSGLSPGVCTCIQGEAMPGTAATSMVGLVNHYVYVYGCMYVCVLCGCMCVRPVEEWYTRGPRVCWVDEADDVCALSVLRSAVLNLE